MEAKDTVIKPTVIKPVVRFGWDIDTLLNDQAEISFKAGYEQVWKDGIIKHTFKEGKRAGRREVVEWVNKNIAFANIGLSYNEWQAFLKEKGIK